MAILGRIEHTEEPDKSCSVWAPAAPVKRWQRVGPQQPVLWGCRAQAAAPEERRTLGLQPPPCSRLRGGAPAPTAGPPAWTRPCACRSSAYLPQVAPDPALAAVSQVAGLAPEPGLQTWEGKTRCLQPGPAGGAGARGPREALAVRCRARRGLWPGRWDSAVHSVEGLARHPGASARQQLKPRLLRGLQSLRAASNWLNRPVRGQKPPRCPSTDEHIKRGPSTQRNIVQP